ncbi:MAG TPA: deoxyribonuclease IV [Acidobacteriota bacterium]|nr:deoxyribonuclease IV [Acidobacteriota bacterium]
MGYEGGRRLLAGAHMSIAGGLHKALERGRQVDCRTVQFFLKNSNQWEAKPLAEEDRILFQKAREETGISPLVAHSSYLINLASPDPALYEKSLDAFIEEMVRANFIGVPLLVIHPGSHTGAGAEAGIARVAAAIGRALKQVAPPVSVLLENTAGQGSSIGSRFEELAAIMRLVQDRRRVGVCFDTSHAFAAGYDLRTKPEYIKTMCEFDRLIGLSAIRAFHVNDSGKELGSRVDRHFHIGKGCIGLDAFRYLVNDSRFTEIPKILETPKGPDLKEDRMNLAALHSLFVP